MTVLERGGGRAGFRAPATRAQEAPKEKTMLVLGHTGHRITRRVLEKIGCISTRVGSAPHPARGPAAAWMRPTRCAINTCLSWRAVPAPLPCPAGPPCAPVHALVSARTERAPGLRPAAPGTGASPPDRGSMRMLLIGVAVVMRSPARSPSATGKEKVAAASVLG